MNRSEVAKMLTLVSVYDHRTVGDSDVEAWSLLLADIPADDAMQAVLEHFAEHTSWLMPADVLAGARRIDFQRRGREARLRVDAEIEAGFSQGPVTPRPPLELIIGQPVDKTPPRGPYDPERLAAARAELDAIRNRAGALGAQVTS